MRRFRAFLRVLVLLVVAGIAAGVYVAYAPYGDTAAHPFNQDRNAVWLEHRWLEKPHSAEEMEQMMPEAIGVTKRASGGSIVSRNNGKEFC